MVLGPRWDAGRYTDERDSYHREEKATFFVCMSPIEHFTFSFFQIWDARFHWQALGPHSGTATDESHLARYPRYRENHELDASLSFTSSIVEGL
jgi:hypothetical protein